MNKYIYSGIVSLLFVGVMLVPSAQAHEGHVHTTDETSSMTTLEQIKALMAKIEELQKQLGTVRGEVKAVIKAGLTEGATDEDIKKIQEILATDSAIYPEGKVTGYYGPLTKEAIKRFQLRHELDVTGIIDDATRDLLEEYLAEKTDKGIPPGLLRAPGIAKKMEVRFKERCDKDERGEKKLCERLKMKYKDDHAEDDADEDDSEEQDDKDEESDEESEAKDATVREANKAIADATKALYEAKDEIDDADGDTDDAQDLLADAKAKLVLARRARNDDEYSKAVELAHEARRLADDAKDLVEEDESDDEDEDEDEDDDDDSEDDEDEDEDDEDED